MHCCGWGDEYPIHNNDPGIADLRKPCPPGAIALVRSVEIFPPPEPSKQIMLVLYSPQPEGYIAPHAVARAIGVCDEPQQYDQAIV
jgi:hypothetical protein